MLWYSDKIFIAEANKSLYNIQNCHKRPFYTGSTGFQIFNAEADSGDLVTDIMVKDER